MKVCTKCGVEKAVDAFGSNRRSRDGKHSHCRECKRLAAAARLSTNGEHVRALGREHYLRTQDEQCERQRDYRRENRPRLREYFSRYRVKRPDVIGPLQQRWNAANPDKRRAHSALWNAIRAGRIVPPKQCQDCGADGRIEGHHDDYSKPLEVRWLCGTCHEEADRARRAAERKAG